MNKRGGKMIKKEKQIDYFFFFFKFGQIFLQEKCLHLEWYFLEVPKRNEILLKSHIFFIFFLTSIGKLCKMEPIV